MVFVLSLSLRSCWRYIARLSCMAIVMRSDYFFTFASVSVHDYNQKSPPEEKYKIEYPHPEDFVIEMLVNPCGVNDTNVDSDITIPLGYDCCMNRYGRGEFGFLNYLPSNDPTVSDSALNRAEIFEKRLPAGPTEVLHNMVIVDEDGVEIPFEYSRRADDHTEIDESCRGFRNPHRSCLEKRLRAFTSPYVPSCWDHNQTVDSTASCYSPEGIKRPNCMQVSYSQNSFINVCGGIYYDDPNCGTFIEIHRPNGSPYDFEATLLSETKIINRETNGMSTTTIDLTYKSQSNRILCAYSESKIRVGSMVQITEDSPQCCCPPKYNKLSKLGSFFCPRKKGFDSGPFVDALDTIAEQIENDRDQQVYPYCHDMKENQDMLMCSRELGFDFGDADSDILHTLIGPQNSLYYTETCQAIEMVENGRLSSRDLVGGYGDTCQLGGAFQACGASDDNNKCASGDNPFNFRNRIGKVTRTPQHRKDKLYGVSFNDGRTEYNFPIEYLELQEPQSNYELWFVQRNRFERILQKRKGFRVVWPECTFDAKNDRYFPFAQLAAEGNTMKVLVENDL